MTEEGPKRLALLGTRAAENKLTEEEWREWLSLSTTPEAVAERAKWELRSARSEAAELFEALSKRYGEAAARQSFEETIDREAGRPPRVALNNLMLEHYAWLKEHKVRNARLRSAEVFAFAFKHSEDPVGAGLERLKYLLKKRRR